MSDQADFERVYRQHYSRVFGYLARRLDYAVVDDATADVFVIAWRRRHDMPDRPTGWLLGIAANVIAQHYRRQSRLHRTIESMQQLLGHADVPDLAHGVSERLATTQALMSLSEPDREVLLLSCWEDLTTAEGAAALGCSSGAYRVRLTRARARFRDALANGDPTEDPEPEFEGDNNAQRR